MDIDKELYRIIEDKDKPDCFGSLHYRSKYPEIAHVYVWLNAITIKHEVNFENCISCHYRWSCSLGYISGEEN
jgi:hypothetical protein